MWAFYFYTKNQNLYLQKQLYILNYIRKDIDEKSIVWFENTNQYLIFEPKTADIISDLLEDKPLELIGKNVSETLDLPYEKAIDFVIDINENIVKKQRLENTNHFSGYQHQKFIKSYEYQKCYSIHNCIVLIEYQSKFELELIHPKFAYLEVDSASKPNLHLSIFTDNGHTFLLKDNTYFKDWSRKDIHYLQGKVSMLIVQEMYNKEEDTWMGVFHASALSDGKKSILFLGDSGHGKSTSLALLQGAKYRCVADDFVPIGNDKKVYPFPSAISVKHTSWEMLSKFYPNLNSEKDYHFSSHNKTVKYLSPNQQNFNHVFDSDKLVFIRYYKDIDTLFSPMSHLEAFERLLPDSWISPLKQNVSGFLEWFSVLKCYSLTYSNNQEMFDLVSKLYNDEL